MLRRKPRPKSNPSSRILALTLLCSLLLAADPAFAQSAAQPPTPPDAQPAPSLNAPSLSTQTDQDNPLHTASRTELDVVKVVLAQENAWNAGDIEGYVRGYKNSPDTLFIDKQVTKGYRQILEDYKHNYLSRSSMGTLTYSELEVDPVTDAVAICTGKYHLERGKKDGGPADGLFSLVLQKTTAGWKIVLDHTT
jgi:ketosteroid isomerase-like protein